MRSTRVAALGAAILTYLLIVLGAVVRTTNSGLSCPDWPTCYGHWLPLPSDIAAIPDLGYTYGQVMLEWVHRLIAGVFLGPLVLVLAGLTVWHRRARPTIAGWGAALLVLLLVQGALGGLTVLDRNSPWSVAVHLGNALLVLTVTLRVLTLAGGATSTAPGGGLGTLAVTAWGTALLAMVSAAMTAKSGASLACAAWPSCNGELLPDLADGGVRLHLAHRLLAAATAVLLLAFFVRCRRTPGADAGLRRLAHGAAGLVAVQVALGGVLVHFEIPTWQAVLHQALGVLIFAMVTMSMWRCLPSRRALLGEGHGLALRGA